MECLVDFKTWTTNRTKVGEFEFESNDLPLIRVYKTLQTTMEHTYLYSGIGGPCSSSLIWTETWHSDPADTEYMLGSDGEGCNNLENIRELVACSGSYSWAQGTNNCSSDLVSVPTCTWDTDCYGDHIGKAPFDPVSLDDAVVSITLEDNGARRRTVETLVTASYHCTATNLEQLSDEYRTDELIARIRSDLDAQADPGVWSGSGSAWTSLVPSERCADAQKMVYRFRFYGETNVSYRIEWEELTRYADGAVSARPMVENVDGVGGETLSPEHTVHPPYQSATVTVENVRLSVEPDDLTVNGPGTAYIGGVGGNGSGILSDGVCCEPGSLEGAGRGMAFGISLGRAEHGRFAGWLGMWESDGTLDIDALRSTATRPEVEVIQPEGWVRQVRAPQVFADVVRAWDMLSFTVYLYRLAEIGAKTNGLYWTPDPTNAVASWTVSRSGVPGVLTVLTITERRGSAERQHRYEYNRTTQTWTLDYPDNLRQDVIEFAAVGVNRYYTGTVKGPGGVEVYRIEQKFEQFAWGSGLVYQRIGVGTNQLITTSTYSSSGFSAFDGMANGTAVPLEQVNFPDGRWERYSYDNDGRLTQRIGPFLNAGPDAPSSECRTVDYVYQDGAGLWQPRVPRAELAKVQDWPVQRTLRDLSEFTFSEARCLDLTTTNLNTTGNLLTVRRYYQAPANLKHLLQSIQFPDGTREAYFYSSQNGYQTNVVLRGQPDPANLTNVLSGTKIIISLGSFGQVLRRKVQDLQTGIVLADDQYQYTDEWLRSYQVTHLDQTLEQFQYGCCGLEQFTDRDGAVTTYQYDSLRRRVETQRLGIRTTNQLDAIGNALTTVRLGTNGTNAIVLDRSAYDLGGQRYVQTNALGGVTLFCEGRDSVSGGITNRVIHPDGGVRLERRARDGLLLEVSGTAAHPQQFLYGIDAPGEIGPERWPMYLPFTVQINLSATGATNEWTRTYQDRFGRDYKSVYPDSTPDDLSDNPARQTWFNTKGQVWKERDADGVVLLYGYNAKGERDYAALDLNRNDAIDFGGTDRITWTTNDVTTYSGVNVRRTRTIVYANNNSTAILTNAMTQTAVSGLKSWQTSYRDSATAVTTVTESTYGTNGTRTVTVTAPDGSSVVSVYSYGRPQSVTHKDSGGAQVAQTSYQYDNHGRPWKVTDARNGTTLTTYNEADQALTVTAPPLGTGEPAQVTRTFYDSQGRVTGTQLPDGATRTNLLAPTGLVLLTQGGRSYPVAYAYDAQGRLQTMTTWKDFTGNAGAATNQWAYDEQGRLRAKNYPDPVSGAVVAGSGPVYTNSPAGRLQTRDWKRGVRTTYAYNAAGALASVTYSDGTPGVVYTYDRRGRLATVARNGITTALTYNDANQPMTETHGGGTLALLSMKWAYDTSLRLSAVTAKNGANTLQSATYGYDTAGRLQSVTDSPRSAAYTYHANSTLISTVILTNSGTAGLVSTRAYDKLNRLRSISTGTSSNGVGVAALSYGYQYNAANQRTRLALGDGSYWVYGYDALGQVVWGRRYWGDGTPVAGQQFEYGFDDTGNRKSSGGRASAVGSYTNNLLNQLTGRGVAPYVDVLGLANPTTNVALRVVGGTTYNADRKGEYFHWPLSVPNATAQYPQIEVKSLYGATQTDTGRVFVPPAGEVFQHDADGNLRADGRWTYTWDGENRLVQMIRDTDTPAGARQKLVFEYDHQGRRIRKQFYTRSGSNWVEQRDTICLYEGWNVVAELDANASNVRLRTYVWGLDLSGTRQGAGGVGGLLWVNNYQTSYGGQTLPTGVQYAVLDGNGNVVGLAKAADATMSARYEYGPFGEVIRATGPMARVNPFRWSTKYQDDETDLVMYPARPYSPSTGRWLSRDPKGERGGINLYGYVSNDPVGKFDPFGLDAAVINHGGYTGHTSFVIINPDGSVTAYHFYAKSHQTGKCCGLGSLLAVCCDKVSVWQESANSLQAYLQSQEALGGGVKIAAYAFGTPLDDELSIDDLNEQDKADAGIYSLALGIECHKKSWEWFNEYLEGGPQVYPTPLPGQPYPPYWPEKWYETRRHRQTLPQVPVPPAPAPAR